MNSLFTPEGLISLLTLSLLEVVLGIDNIIFISIVAAKLPHNQQDRARKLGLILALVARVILLFGITWVMGLTADLITIAGNGLSGRDLILLGGGLFLIYKTGGEILERFKVEEHHGKDVKAQRSFAGTIFQIVLIDIVFSFDSILTAVGLVKEIEIMIAAVIVSMTIMWFFSKLVADFVNKYATVKMLALVFLVAIGVLLVLEALEIHGVDKSYLYFAMGFSLVVEFLNIYAKAIAARHTREAHKKAGH